MKEEETLLHKACISGQVDFAGYLLGKGADPNSKNDRGVSCLSSAVANGWKEVVELLLSVGATVDEEEGRTSPLSLAVADGDPGMVSILLQASADVAQRNAYGLTPLHLASALGHQEIVDLLLSHLSREVPVRSSTDAEPDMPSTDISFSEAYNSRQQTINKTICDKEDVSSSPTHAKDIKRLEADIVDTELNIIKPILFEIFDMVTNAEQPDLDNEGPQDAYQNCFADAMATKVMEAAMVDIDKECRSTYLTFDDTSHLMKTEACDENKIQSLKKSNEPVHERRQYLYVGESAEQTDKPQLSGLIKVDDIDNNGVELTPDTHLTVGKNDVRYPGVVSVLNIDTLAEVITKTAMDQAMSQLKSENYKLHMTAINLSHETRDNCDILTGRSAACLPETEDELELIAAELVSAVLANISHSMDNRSSSERLETENNVNHLPTIVQIPNSADKCMRQVELESSCLGGNESDDNDADIAYTNYADISPELNGGKGQNNDSKTENKTADMENASRVTCAAPVLCDIACELPTDVDTKNTNTTAKHAAGQKRKESITKWADPTGNELNKRRKVSGGPSAERGETGEEIINLRSPDGKSALYLACENRRPGVAVTLLGRGADILAAEKHFGLTPLHIACLTGDEATVTSLLQHDDSITGSRAFDGSTPLFLAACSGKADIVRLLSNWGADVNISRDGGWNPLHTASEKGFSDIVQLLLENGGSVNAINDEGATPFYQAACHGRVVTMSVLLGFGANINLQTKCGWGPLHIACKNSHMPAIQFLINKGADINIQSSSGVTPLLRACQNVDLPLTEYLLEHGADPSLRDGDGVSALMLATQLGSEELAHPLLTAGVDVNQAWEETGLTPLHLACMHGHRELAQLYLEHEGNIYVRDTEGFSPGQWADEYGHDNVADLIKIYDQDVKEAISCLPGMTPPVRAGEEENMRVWIQLHPHIAARYIPVKSPGDKGTIWDMISVCLTGSVTLQSDLRRVTANVISNHPLFRQILYNELMKSTLPETMPADAEGSRTVISTAVNRLSSEALAKQSTGNKYHLLALSIAVRRPIYIYKSCQDPTGLYYYMKKGVSELARAFQEGFDGTKQHLRFQPEEIKHKTRRPLFGYTCSTNGGYFPLLPKSQKTDIFEPSTDLFQNLI